MENTEMGVVTNTLPQEIFSRSALITQFYVFKWKYFYDDDNRVRFNELVVPEIVKETLEKQYWFSKSIKETSYVFDRRIFIRLVKEIQYFKSIHLIDENSVNELRNELLSLIDYLEEISITGTFTETGNKVDLYITDMEVPFCCSNIGANEIQYTLMKTFILTSATSFDKTVFQKTKDWVHSSIRVSTVITKSSEVVRLAFFEKQKEVVKSL